MLAVERRGKAYVVTKRAHPIRLLPAMLDSVASNRIHGRRERMMLATGSFFRLMVLMTGQNDSAVAEPSMTDTQHWLVRPMRPTSKQSLKPLT